MKPVQFNNRTYLGNDKLRKAGVKVEYTEEQVKEYLKCSDDPIYFIRNYVHIVNLNKGKMLFDLYDCQEKLIDHYNDNRFSLLMAARQSGKCLKNSTYINIRNTKTGESKKITIGEFYELQTNKNKIMS